MSADPLTPEQLEILRGMGEPMSAAKIPRFLRAFIYGDPGHGKTHLVAELVQELNLKPIWVSTDSGWTTVTKFPYVAERTWKIPFDSFAHIRLMVQAHNEGIEPFCGYDTLIWDTVSTSINTMLRYLVETKKLPKEQADPSVEGRGHYRMVEAGLKDTVKLLTESNLHVIYTAHIRDPTDQDREKKRFAIRPAGPEASYRVIAQEVNLLGWLYKENRGSERLIQFEPTLQETAKTQIPTIREKTYKVTEIPELISKFINQ
jgi:hypothetical protein